MSREQPCDKSDAATRVRVAVEYLELAERAAEADEPAARAAAAGNAVLAAIAASDAICCLRLGFRNRSESHADAVTLIERVRPDGKQLAGDLRAVLSEKDTAHYGLVFTSSARLKAVLRASARLVAAAEDLTGR